VADVWGVGSGVCVVDPFLDRSHSYRYNSNVRCRTVSFLTNNLIYCFTVAVGRVTVNRVEHRALGLAVLLRCSHSSYQIHGSLHGPRSCGLVRGDTAHRTTGCPVCLTCATCTSRCLLPLAPHCFKRLGPAPRTAAPRGRAPSATRMWSAGRPDVKDLRVTTCSPLLRPWNLLPCRSPP
jgi:hypothetical protein